MGRGLHSWAGGGWVAISKSVPTCATQVHGGERGAEGRGALRTGSRLPFSASASLEDVAMS